MAAGGDAIGRDEGGRVVFVDGALPGELVEVEVFDERRDFARARVVEVLSASPSRVSPPCPALLEGCGGCQWQHVAEPDQLPLKVSVVVDALRRLGRFAPDAIPPITTASVAAAGHRTTLRLAVDRDGRPSYRLRHSHELLAPASCLVAHPRLEELVVAGRFPRAREVTARVSASSGARLAVVTPRAGKPDVPDDVVVVGMDELKRGRQVFLEEAVAGRTWRVSALSFFQSGPTGAGALAEAVDAMVGSSVAEGGLIVDAYAGVGLLGGVVASRRGARLVAVESSASSVADAAVNLRDLDHTVVRASVERWRPSLPSTPDVVIADPPRAGLGAAAVAVLVGIGASRLVLVACDPASLARDARQLVDAGYTLSAVDVIDLFPHTFHVEAVARFDRIVRDGQHPVPSR
jgi:23S rRNA (uracil1939-C5)-methyltransferase